MSACAWCELSLVDRRRDARFCSRRCRQTAWLFDCLGMRPGDELDDLFPGTGIVARAWRELGGPRGATWRHNAATGAR